MYIIDKSLDLGIYARSKTIVNLKIRSANLKIRDSIHRFGIRSPNLKIWLLVFFRLGCEIKILDCTATCASRFGIGIRTESADSANLKIRESQDSSIIGFWYQCLETSTSVKNYFQTPWWYYLDWKLIVINLTQFLLIIKMNVEDEV